MNVRFVMARGRDRIAAEASRPRGKRTCGWSAATSLRARESRAGSAKRAKSAHASRDSPSGGSEVACESAAALWYDLEIARRRAKRPTSKQRLASMCRRRPSAPRSKNSARYYEEGDSAAPDRHVARPARRRPSRLRRRSRSSSPRASSSPCAKCARARSRSAKAAPPRASAQRRTGADVMLALLEGAAERLGGRAGRSARATPTNFRLRVFDETDTHRSAHGPARSRPHRRARRYRHDSLVEHAAPAGVRARLAKANTSSTMRVSPHSRAMSSELERIAEQCSRGSLTCRTQCSASSTPRKPTC